MSDDDLLNAALDAAIESLASAGYENISRPIMLDAIAAYNAVGPDPSTAQREDGSAQEA